VEWSWHTQGGQNVLYWHWSPNNGWSMNHEIRGWNECLITYLLAASAPRYPIHPEIYHRGFGDGRAFRNGRAFYDIPAARAGLRRPTVPCPVLVLGLDPRGLILRHLAADAPGAPGP
jgi:putative glucoamylase